MCDVRTDNCPLPIIQAAAHDTTASTAATHTGLAHPYKEKDCELYNVTVMKKCSINLLFSISSVCNITRQGFSWAYIQEILRKYLPVFLEFLRFQIEFL